MSRNGPDYAFPFTADGGEINRGMTLREHYTGLAMQGLLANNDWMLSLTTTAKQKGAEKLQIVEVSLEVAAHEAVMAADALIKELDEA